MFCIITRARLLLNMTMIQRPSFLPIYFFCYLWPDLQKPDIITHFSNSILLHFYNLHTQMYVLAKFQLRILKPFEVTVLQSSSNRKIDFYSKHRKNTLQAFFKTDVTYKWSEVGTRILHHHVRHELRNGLLGKLFLLQPCITTIKVKIYEETLVANNCFDVTWTNGHNLQFLVCTATKQRFSSLGKYDGTQALTVGLFLHREQGR